MAIQFDGKADNIADMLNVSLWCAKYSGNTVNHEYIVPIQCSCIYRAWINSFNLQWSVTSFQLSVTSYYFRLYGGQTCTSAMRKEKKNNGVLLF